MPKLIFPQEIEVWYILPVIRRKIALKLVQKGRPQKEVAEMMGLTPAAISQYKQEKRATEKHIFDKEMEVELEHSVNSIINKTSTIATEIIRLSNLTKQKGLVCKMYKDICALNKETGSCPYCHKK